MFRENVRSQLASVCCDDILVLIPKKCDLSKYDNWRDILLLEFVEKVVDRVLQEGLQKRLRKNSRSCSVGFGRGDAAQI